MHDDKRYMEMALNLARKGLGRTSPNPMVGAVVVKEGQVVAEGYHRAAGTDHAEIVALKKAGELASGGVIYVTLEPCSHYGRTGPCTQALIKAGVKKVVAAMEDPNPLVAGSGFKQLREAGIEVKSGVLEQQARRLNEVFIKYIVSKRPFVSLKTAMTMDGKIATCSGESRWITGEESRSFVHRLRDSHDAIMVGIGTVLTDNPALTTRLPEGGRDPLRVIVDTHGRLPIEARVINRASQAAVIAAVSSDAPLVRVRALQEQGVEVLTLPRSEGGVDLQALMKALGERGITSVLAEGGATLNYSLLAAGLADKLYLFMAPKIFGGDSSPTAVGGKGISSIADAFAVEQLQLDQLGRDYLFTGYF